jgi:hypothetical protein
MELNKEHFDEQMKALGGRLNKLDAAVDRIAVQVAHLTEEAAAIREAMPSKELINKLYNAADTLTKEVIGYRTEQAAVDHRLEKIENWITNAAPNVDVAFQQ